MLIAPAPERPLNSSAAPDVRAPSVRGRWHFWGSSGLFLPRSFGAAAWLPLGFPRRYRIYAGGMNEAIRPEPESPPEAVAALQLSVVVPTFNERDNVTTLFRRLETALAGFTWEVIFVDDNSPDRTWDVV